MSTNAILTVSPRIRSASDKNLSSSGGASDSKYGDDDVSSKRRKSLTDLDNLYKHQLVFDIPMDDNEYRQFEEIVRAHSLNSSFQVVHDADGDFKGGLLRRTTNSTGRIETIYSSDPEDLDKTSSAKMPQSRLMVSEKPSLSSHGFENTIKMLESHVQWSAQRSQSLLQTLGSPTTTLSYDESSSSSGPKVASSSLGDSEAPTRLDLELEASERIRRKVSKDGTEKCENCDNTAAAASAPFIGFLHRFVAKNPSYRKAVDDGEAKQQQQQNCAKSEPKLIYHAHKRCNGKNCIRVLRNSFQNKVLCGNRVSQMTRAYDDIEAVTRLLEEKEKDLELTVQIGKELLTQNNALEARINELESDLKSSTDDRAQLVHELHKKNELIAVLTNDDGMDETPTLSKSITVDLLQKKIATLVDENKVLRQEASQLARETDQVEAQERALMEGITSQLSEANSQYDHLNLELERLREENRMQHEQIVGLMQRLSDAEMRLHQLTQDNDENLSQLHITEENQNSLALELVEFKQRYQEVLALLQETQEQLRKQRKRTLPQARSSFLGGSNMMSHYQPDSLQSELMESSAYSENSLDSGISGDSQRFGRLMSAGPSVYGGGSIATGSVGSGMSYATSGGPVPPFKRVFDTVRCATKNGSFTDSGNVSMSQLGAMSMSSSSGVRMSAMAGGNAAGSSHPAGSFYRNSSAAGYNDGLGLRTLSCESLASQSDDGYPTQQVGVPGAPGAKDLEAALKRLTPAEVLARRAMLSYGPAGSYNYDDQQPSHNANQPMGIRTPDSIMSTGSSGISSSTHMSSSVVHQWRLPEKLQIVKPIEGSQTLHHWSRLATPTLSGLLEERPGVTIRGGRGLDDLGMQVYTLSDVEEDVSDDLPGKQFEASGCTFTYTTSMVMHPDDGLVNDLSFLSQSQVSSRMASTSTSRQPSCPPTPRGLSRKNSCSTFSVDLSLASMLNERGIKAVTPSALNTPAGPNFSPTVTPCNSPEGSPTRSMSPEPLFGILSSGADLIRRKLVGGDIERPNRNQKQQQKHKILLTRLERRALRSLKLVEKVESLGLENIITTQPNAMSQLASGIASRSTSPMAQLTSLKNIHTAPHNMDVDDLHFDRQQIKDVLHKGLQTPMRPSPADKKPAASLTLEVKEDSPRSTCSSTTSSQSHSSTALTAVPMPSASAAAPSDTRLKQMQRQKSRRNLKNGIAQQRPDLGTTGAAGSGGGRVRPDLGKVGNNNDAKAQSNSKLMANPSTSSSGGAPSDATPREAQSITQSFVGTVSSLLFGRKGGWL